MSVAPLFTSPLFGKSAMYDARQRFSSFSLMRTFRSEVEKGSFMSLPLRLSILVMIALTTASLVRAEKINMSSSQLHMTATHVIEGQVLAIYQRTEQLENWKLTRLVAEVRVDRCDKGEGIQKGDLIYARYWHREWIGKGTIPPSTNGHRGLPNEKDKVRIYLARNAYDGFSFENKDGGFNVIGANGFEKLNETSIK